MEFSPSSEISLNLGLVHNVLECSPTSLTLKYTNKDFVPSTAILNKLLCCFGPLIESKTELLAKTNSARVVFEKRCDAETAFTHIGKYRFGSALQSFHLKVLSHKPKKGTGKRGRKSKKQSTSVHGVSAV